MSTVDTVQEQAHINDGVDAPRRPLGSLLVEAGLIDEDQLAEALHDGTQTGERLGEVVVRRGWATEDDVARLLAEQWNLSYVDRASMWFDANALARLSREDAQNIEALPVRVEGDRVMVAVAEPTEQRLAELRRLIGDDTVVVVVPRSALDAGIRSELLTSRGHAAEMPDVGEESELDEQPATVRPLRALPGEGPDPDDLAAQARGIADFIAGQAAVAREYERRVETLEAELAQSRAAMQEAKTQLAAVSQLLDVLKQSG
jgi:type II secretion system (T2SS) protein E